MIHHIASGTLYSSKIGLGDGGTGLNLQLSVANEYCSVFTFVVILIASVPSSDQRW